MTEAPRAVGAITDDCLGSRHKDSGCSSPPLLEPAVCSVMEGMREIAIAQRLESAGRHVESSLLPRVYVLSFVFSHGS
jgi:hypothetical protein